MCDLVSPDDPDPLTDVVCVSYYRLKTTVLHFIHVVFMCSCVIVLFFVYLDISFTDNIFFPYILYIFMCRWIEHGSRGICH